MQPKPITACRLVPIGPQPANPRLNLIAVPYAGGNSQALRGWQSAATADCSFLVAELPGRGTLVQAPRFADAEAAAADLARAIAQCGRIPFALIGHSMGALLCYLVAREFQRGHHFGPAHLFLSGFRAPHLPDVRPRTAKLSDEDFVLELTRLGGTPPEVIGEQELMDYLLPILRSDFELVENFEYQTAAPLPYPITVFSGSTDQEAGPDQMRSWSEHTCRKFRMEIVEGGHFFIQDPSNPMFCQVRKTLTELFHLSSSAGMTT